MAEEELQTQVSIAEEHADEHAEEHAVSTDETTGSGGQGDEGEQHVVSDHVEATSDDAHVNGASEEPAEGSEGANVPKEPEPIAEAPTEPTPEPLVSPPETPKKAAATASPAKARVTGRPSVSTKPAASKALGAPATPTVKKILNSGTFGAGAARTAPPAAATTIRKTSSTTPASTTRASMPPPPTTRNVSAATPAAPTRRTSLAPGAKPATTAPVRTATSVGKPTSPAITTSRPSVVSPDSVSSIKSSTSARPRASVTDAARRTTPATRTSLGPSTTNRPPSTASTRPTRTPGSASISSIREVRDDSKALEELQSKLTEATASLEAKTQAVAELESQIAALQASLDEAQKKDSTATELEKAKAEVESELASLKAALDEARAGQDSDGDLLKAVQQELAEAKTANETQLALVDSLQSQIGTLETEVAAAKQNLDVIKSSSGEASEVAAAAAAVEHDALIKAKADLASISSEVESLKAEHAQALAEAQEKISALEGKAARSTELEAELAQLRTESEENASRVSELEVEILELKEEQEKIQDEHSTSLERIKTLEAELTQSAAAMQQAVDVAIAKQEELSSSSDAAAQAHAEQLKNASGEYEKLGSQLKALQEELAAATLANEQAKADAAAASEERKTRLEELEKEHQTNVAALNEEVQRLTTELESQESKYNTKVDAVKAEHDKLLEEAFVRAKADAGAIHSQELQALRAQSSEAIEAIRTGHLSTVDSLKAEHAAALDNQVKTLEKQIANQSLELNATREDLAKAKAAHSTAAKELESTKLQLEQARQIVSTLDKSDKDATLARLSQDLANLREEHSALQDMLMAQNDTLRQVTNNHTTELEEAAKGRAEEVTKLRAAHQEELDALTKDRTDLSIQFSDLQGELATLKASQEADPLTSSRSNGAVTANASTVTKEDLQKMHEAHNLKLYDLQAEHDRAMRALKEELEAALAKADDLNQELARKTMEIQYLEQDQEESQDQITRLKADNDQLIEERKARNQE